MMPPTDSAPAAWGLVGLGRHAAAYIAPAISESELATLHAVCSTSPERAQAFATAHRVPYAYDSLSAMLADPAIQYVFVCSANTEHERQVIEIARAGRHVLCEKPLAPTESACMAIAESCDRHQVVLGVGFHLRSSPALRAAREQLAGGVIGEVVYAEIQYMHVGHAKPATHVPQWRRDLSHGGAEFGGSGLHVLDVTRFLLDTEFKTVTSHTYRELGSNPSHQVVHTTAVMDSGTVVSISSGKVPAAPNAATFLGTKGTLRVEGAIGNDTGGTVDIRTHRVDSTWRFPTQSPYRIEIDDFMTAVRSGTRPTADATDALRALRVVEAITRSAANRKEEDVV